MGYACALAVWMALFAGQPSDGLIPQLRAEVARLRTEVAERVSANARPPLNDALDRAADALTKNRPAVAVYELEQPWEVVSAQRFVDGADQITTKEAFADLWKRRGEPMPSRDTRPLPAIVEALAMAAEARAPATYRASLPFGSDTNIPSGLFYLGSASAFVEYASFLRHLPWPQARGASPQFRSVAPELSAFEQTVTSAYETMDRSQHTPYVRTSVTIKQARTLDDEQRFAAAMLEYLLARYRFGSIHAPRTNPDPSRLVDARAALSDGRDDSIALFFVDLAETATSAAGTDDRTPVSIVLDDVLPAYRDALVPRGVALTAAPAAQVTITLVRWPFT